MSQGGIIPVFAGAGVGLSRGIDFVVVSAGALSHRDTTSVVDVIQHSACWSGVEE